MKNLQLLLKAVLTNKKFVAAAFLAILFDAYFDAVTKVMDFAIDMAIWVGLAVLIAKKTRDFKATGMVIAAGLLAGSIDTAWFALSILVDAAIIAALLWVVAKTTSSFVSEKRKIGEPKTSGFLSWVGGTGKGNKETTDLDFDFDSPNSID